ncbi:MULTISPECIES: PaaI family thioesterase [unclassified Pseudodesulfovibrio]|uniref:PaaI family thioesterase n=1 Tax=unclassified Pseudodesulfovibrio TaxID=2661612 RepID=UPI000FEBEE50|nr:MULTISPECIES: PaaI family thioesterase [unclassified Pseudodesulfovibrio]MCJ2166024.1 PaaI family thioesterase [Pseudodesulfovibrio sp. S3-i]RWU02538.1 PaaI family thioesterase [Pseudodesulfovibrio sp. S3]
MPKTYLEAVRLTEQTVNPLFAFLGIQVKTIEPDRAVLCLPFRPELMQGGGLVAGGILATLLDEAMAHAVLGGNRPDQRTTTVNLSVSYLRPVHCGQDLTCEARVAKRGSRMLFVEATALADQREVARAAGSFLLLP